MKRLMKMDFHRCIFSGRLLFSVVGMSAFLILSAGDMLRQSIQDKSLYGAVDLLLQPMAMDKYKVIIAVILSGIYTDAYCQDEKTGNLKNVLIRTDVFAYAVSKSVINTCSIILASGVSFSIVFFIFRFMGLSGECKSYHAFYCIANSFPYLFVLMTSMEFGMVVSACSMVGILVSSMQPSAFISIGCAGLTFFLAVSYLPLGTIFDVYNLISMWPTLPGKWDTPQVIMLAWGLLYPMCVIGVCTAFFSRKLMRRIHESL